MSALSANAEHICQCFMQPYPLATSETGNMTGKLSEEQVMHFCLEEPRGVRAENKHVWLKSCLALGFRRRLPAHASVFHCGCPDSFSKVHECGGRERRLVEVKPS